MALSPSLSVSPIDDLFLSRPTVYMHTRRPILSLSLTHTGTNTLQPKLNLHHQHNMHRCGLLLTVTWPIDVSLQHTAAHCNTLQHTATHCNTLQRKHNMHRCGLLLTVNWPLHVSNKHNHTRSQALSLSRLSHTHQNRCGLTSRNYRPHCTYHDSTRTYYNTEQHTASHYNRLQRTATQCNTLQHTATHCNTLQLSQ